MTLTNVSFFGGGVMCHEQPEWAQSGHSIYLRCPVIIDREKRRPCRSPAVRGRARNRMHGGARGSGGPEGRANGAWRHGGFTRETQEVLRKLRAWARAPPELSQTRSSEARAGWSSPGSPIQGAVRALGGPNKPSQINDLCSLFPRFP